MADLILGTRFYSYGNTSTSTMTTTNSHPAISGSVSHANKLQSQEVTGDPNSSSGPRRLDSSEICQRVRNRMEFQRHGRHASDDVTQPGDLSRPRSLDFAVASSNSLPRPLTKGDEESG